MSWTRVLVLPLLTTLLVLTLSGVVGGAAVQADSAAAPEGAARQVFVPESDASNFFKRRSRRSTRYYEQQGKAHVSEQRARLSASEQRREYNEEQRDENENYAEEVRDEQDERSREVNEQLREYHYDGLQPQRYWFH
ncbi:putative cartilage matrix-associated protein [Liparis tanakae]|uniref:Unique cartilage matrix-associated protein n=1 Tax=Liparis tanakae TaxID=230148 RepID=A0A4Z2G3U0_9TELE|nr:putative cartilage matrix-associated protein [Liparis tanakae]